MGGKGILLAWLTGLGIITWREVSTYHQPPVPGRLLGASGWFALLALLASYEPAAGAAAAIAWGTDLAALLNLLPSVLAGTQQGTQGQGTTSSKQIATGASA
jgi:hypothetical protein